MQSVLCLHAHVNVCSWIQQGTWYLQRLSSHKCYHLKRNLQVWSFLIDVLHSSKTYLRTSHSWLSCNGKINHSNQITNLMFEWFWCASQRQMLLQWTSEYGHEFCSVGWKRSFWKNFVGFCWNYKHCTSTVSGIIRTDFKPIPSKLKVDVFQ